MRRLSRAGRSAPRYSMEIRPHHHLLHFGKRRSKLLQLIPRKQPLLQKILKDLSQMRKNKPTGLSLQSKHSALQRRWSALSLS